VALLGERNAYPVLKKFALLASVMTFIVALAFVFTPLSQWWLSVIANLQPEAVFDARVALGLVTPLTILTIYISFLQGLIVNQEKTGAVAEAVVIFLVFMGVVLGIGIMTQAYHGIYIAATSFTVAHISQIIWLQVRSRNQRKLLRESK